MFRFVNSARRISNHLNTAHKVSSRALLDSIRFNSSSNIAVQDRADPRAKAEALKRLQEVVSVIGRHPDNVGGPVYDEAWVQQQVNFYNRPDIDSWEIRRGIHVLAENDCIPEPVIIIAVFKACRRLNDYALAIRFQEFVLQKCGNHINDFWPYIMQEVKPTMDELGIDTLEALGYDKPELAVVDICDIH